MFVLQLLPQVLDASDFQRAQHNSGSHLAETIFSVHDPLSEVFPEASDSDARSGEGGLPTDPSQPPSITQLLALRPEVQSCSETMKIILAINRAVLDGLHSAARSVSLLMLLFT